MALDATPGSPTANSYATRVEADAYFAMRLFTTVWDAASDGDQDKALMWATFLLDAFYEWEGAPTFEDQALGFPRTGLLSRNKLALASDTIPSDLKRATAALAGLLLVSDLTAMSDIQAQGITSLKAGPVALTFKDDLSLTVVPATVQALIPPWWYVSEEEADDSDEAWVEVI